MSLKVQQGEKTKTALIEYAESLFADKGFNGVRFDQIAKDKGLTAGALYHHFKNKRDLFEKVFETCATNISQKVSESAGVHKNILNGITAGCLTYIEQTISPQYKKIMLEDAISVLGWSKWKSIDDSTSEQGLLEAITEAQNQRLIESKLSAQTLTRFISGGVNELALWVSEASNKSQKLSDCHQIIENIICNLKPRSY